ncbi:MAG: methyltransferase domain-containing protein [Candidatus Heimdallarchaeota archaeon]|nr:methyltransferase domain-containing protein [Candidatus Heimdallarchaeota archaeon]
MKIPRLDTIEGTFSQDLWNRFCSRYGKFRAQKLIDSLSKPVNNFAIRVTTTKTSREEVIAKFETLGWKGTPHDILDEMILIKTKGRNIVNYLPNASRIVIDKIAAESIFVGSDLFGVGIIRVPKLIEGDIVTLISQKDQIIANGISKIDSKNPKIKGVAVQTTNSFYTVPSLRNLGFIDLGEAFSQSIPAAYVAHVLDPKKGDIIVDLCAAPGGKCTSAAIISNDQAKIIALDRSKKRLEKMTCAIENQKLKNIQIINEDSFEYIKHNTIKADKVIVDPSCSAVGVRPKIYDETKETDIINTTNYQKSFLWAAAKIIRKGGTITYSTCTLEPEENEKVIAYGINELGLKLVQPDFLMGTFGEETGDGLDLECMRRFYPDTFDTPGFFIAKLTK